MMKQSNNLCSDSLQLKTKVLTFPRRLTILINFDHSLLFLFDSSLLILTEIFFRNNKCVKL